MSLHIAPNEQQYSVTHKISSELKKELLDLQNLSKDCTIYRVPQRFREVNSKVYSPKVVSIGPIHHGKEELKSMEEHKRRYLRHFLELGDDNLELNTYVGFVRSKETQLRNCYSEAIHLNTEEFMKMILIDAAFLIIILVQPRFRLNFNDDRLFSRPEMIYEIRDDILLLENQIPFFILQDLFELSKLPEYFRRNYHLSSVPDLSGGVDLIKLTYTFFESWIAVPEMTKKIYKLHVEHLLHFLRICYVPQTWHLERKITDPVILPSATELYQAGVKFKPTSSQNLFDINFKDGILEIPPLELLDSTELIFHNLCAYEQCHYVYTFGASGHVVSTNQECQCLSRLISDYTFFMFNLVNSPKDVEFLSRKGIIINRASSSEEVANYFHKVNVGVNISSEFCYGDVIANLNKYCGARWPKWRATLKQDYFKNPWTGISVSAAAILLLLTIIQTVCSILQVT